MFNKKNKKNEKDVKAKSENKAKVPSKAQPKKGASKSKKKNGMSTIFRESVFETVLTEFKENTLFIHKEDGQNKYVGLCLAAATVGGLDKRSRKDEAKGSIIECISSGRMKTYITEDLLDAECIVFVPDAVTVDSMSEFALLTKATYEICFVDEQGDIELIGKDITYQDVVNIFNADTYIDDFLLDGQSDEADIMDAEVTAMLEDEPEQESVNLLDDEDTVDEDAELEDDMEPVYDDDIEAPIEDDEEFNVDAPMYAMPVAAEPVYVQEPAVQAMEMEQQVDEIVEEEHEIPVDWTAAATKRKFYSTDLDLEISTEPFDVQFMHDNPFVLFDDNREPGLINNQLNEMARVANTEIGRNHNSNLFTAREFYFKLMSMSVDTIQMDLDMNNPQTQYGQLKQQLDREHAANMSNVDNVVAKRKMEVEKIWNEKLRAIGLDAARYAQFKYRERYEAAHEQEMYDLDAMVRANFEADYQYNLRELNDRRKAEALRLLDLSVSEVLSEVEGMYVANTEEEHERYNFWQDEILNFSRNNYQDEMSYKRALEEDLSRRNMADRVLAEQTAKRQEIAADYKRKMQEKEDEIESIRRANTATIHDMEREHKRSETRWQAEREELKQHNDALLVSLEKVSDVKENEYKARLAEKDDALKAADERLDHLELAHRRSNRLSMFFVVAALIAVGCIGFIGGEFINSQRTLNGAVASMMPQADVNE